MIKQAAYSTLRTLLPRPVRRTLARLLLPKRMVVTHQELGHSLKFVLYPGKKEDYGLIFSHELEARHLLPQIVQPGDILFDVGAHYGLYTILFSYLVSSQGQVHSFDPITENIQRLQENIQVNGLNNITVNECAVSNTTGVTQMNMGNSTKVASIKNLSGQRQDWREVRTITLDNYWNQIGQPKIHLIKIDVEGAEALVVNGMQTLLQEVSPRVLLELHLFALDEAEKNSMMETLFSNNYAAKISYITDLGSHYRKIPADTFESWEHITPYLEGAHTAGLYLFANTERKH